MGSQSSKALNLQITLNLETAVQGLLLKRISNGFREMCLWIIQTTKILKLNQNIESLTRDFFGLSR